MSEESQNNAPQTPYEWIGGEPQVRDTLAQLGCRTLGELRALPRGGLTRRFGPALVEALDQAYGLRSPVFSWVTLPQTFCATVEYSCSTISMTSL